MSGDDRNVVIAGTCIKRDEHGRYCLNDLHRAAGGQKKHQPSDWIRLPEAQRLGALTSIPGIPGILSKQGLGTYVAWELVYAYAMWISEEFQLTVIRAFHSIVAGGVSAWARYNDLQRTYASELAEVSAGARSMQRWQKRGPQIEAQLEEAYPQIPLDLGLPVEEPLPRIRRRKRALPGPKKGGRA